MLVVSQVEAVNYLLQPLDGDKYTVFDNMLQCHHTQIHAHVNRQTLSVGQLSVLCLWITIMRRRNILLYSPSGFVALTKLLKQFPVLFRIHLL